MIRHDIFVSYSRADSSIVNQIVPRLEKAGFSVWLDKTGIESGDSFKKVIVKAIEDAKVILFFSSESANKSSWTTKEIGVALYENKPIIPIRLDDSKYNSQIKFDLIELDYVDMTNKNNYEDQYQRLVKALRNKCQTNIEKKPEEMVMNAKSVSIYSNGSEYPSKEKKWRIAGFVSVSSILLIGIFFFGKFVIQNHQKTNVEYEVVEVSNDCDYKWLSERHATVDDIRGLTSSEIRLLRNSIYAMHGRKFQSAELRAYFNQYSWYNPKYDEIDKSQLNEIESYNVAFLKSHEK